MQNNGIFSGLNDKGHGFRVFQDPLPSLESAVAKLYPHVTDEIWDSESEEDEENFKIKVPVEFALPSKKESQCSSQFEVLDRTRSLDDEPKWNFLSSQESQTSIERGVTQIVNF